MDWLTAEHSRWISEPWASMLLIFAAILCGLIVGAEREKREKPAGLRTMTLVCLGAAVFTMVSFEVAGTQGDRGRVAAQIVSGIGFLGAGAILRSRAGVRGMTTAATIWAVAATGMVVGSGHPLPGIALSIVILAVLTVEKMVEKRYVGPCDFVRASVVFKPDGGKAAVKIEDILDNYPVESKSRTREKLADGNIRLEFTYCRAHRNHKEFLSHIAELPFTREIRSGEDTA